MTNSTAEEIPPAERISGLGKMPLVKYRLILLHWQCHGIPFYHHFEGQQPPVTTDLLSFH